MAHLHNVLARAHAIVTGVKRALGDTNPDSGVERYSETLQPVVDLWGSPEFAFLRGAYLFHDTNFESAGGAGTRSMVQLVNDSTNALVVLEPGCVFDIDAPGTNLVISRSNVQLATDDGLCLARDGRLDRPEVPFARQRSQTVALPAGISAGEWFSLPSTASYTLQFPIVLRPGSAYTVYANQDQAVVRANWVGWVRHMLPGEEVATR